MRFGELLKCLKNSMNGKAGKPEKNEQPGMDAQKKPEDTSSPKPVIAAKPAVSKPSESDYEHWRSELWLKMQHLAQRTQEFSGTDHRTPFGIRFILQGTKNFGCLIMENTAGDGVQWSLSVQAVRIGSDLCVLHFVKQGTLEELHAYLSDQSSVDELFASLKELSDSVDRHH